VCKANGEAERSNLRESRLAVKEYLGEGYYLIFHWMNYGCNNGKVRNLKKTHDGMSLPL
jgi:hypothetical protein